MLLVFPATVVTSADTPATVVTSEEMPATVVTLPEMPATVVISALICATVLVSAIVGPTSIAPVVSLKARTVPLRVSLSATTRAADVSESERRRPRPAKSSMSAIIATSLSSSTFSDATWNGPEVGKSVVLSSSTSRVSTIMSPAVAPVVRVTVPAAPLPPDTV